MVSEWYLYCTWQTQIAATCTYTTSTHARIQEVLSEGVQFWGFFFVLFFIISWWGEGGSKYHYKWAIVGPPAKRQALPWSANDGPTLNAGLVHVALWFFKVSGPDLQRNPIFFCDFSGEMVQNPRPPPPLDPHVAFINQEMHLWPR